VDKFGTFVIFTVLAVGLAVSFYSWRHLAVGENIGPFFSLLLILLLSLIGVIAAGDLLTLFLFWEGMSVAAYGLVAFRKEVALSLEAALKYLFLAGSGSLIALFGISMIYSLTGSIHLSDLRLLFQKDVQLGTFALAMLIVGLGVEAAIFPLQTWLPDAYSMAPTAVSATLAGVVTETAIFALIKVITPTFVSPIIGQILQPPNPVQIFQLSLVVVAVLTMLMGNLGALAQTNIKRMLSYSSIAHVGYMLAALATFSVVGIVAIIFHIWNHGLVKSCFFMLTGNAGENYDDSELGKVKGLFGQNRLVGGMFALSSLGMMGVPPFGTFWSELLIIQALFATGLTIFYLVAVIIALNIIFSVAYFSKVITAVARGSSEGEKIELSWRLTVSPLLLLLLSLLTGIAPWLFLGRIT
jgi:proton-translocating NADH-quinone oxidoreductase chain N